MKKIIAILFIMCLVFLTVACSNTNNNTQPPSTEKQNNEEVTQMDSTPKANTEKTLVVYFSCTGNTKAVAEKLASFCNAELYEITAAQPYTADDLNYNNSNCRANQEMNDSSARPQIGSETIDLQGYDNIIIGYPIWWGTMPRIINTFLDTYDLSGKTLLPFCTSGGSGISESVADIKNAEPGADVRSGIVANNMSDENLKNWLMDNNID